MRAIRNPSRLILILSALLSVALCASPTSFCKCTCGSNSTIIPLDAPVSPAGHNLLFLRERAENNSTPPTEDGEEKNDNDENEDDDESEGKEDKDKEGKEKEEDDRKEYRPGNCNDCNRQFCLSYNLPICKNVGIEDVFTTCFQRDSRKDEVVVFIFIFATAGLLGWAAVKPWVGKWVEVRFRLLSSKQNG
ncbi:MAG: hypothetical protein Q9191_000718 [Dirinaria sp. TL-2023a]